MQELIRIDSAPARLAVNFGELKAVLAQELERYNVVVTADTVADAKKLAAELNKTAIEIDRRRKEEVAAVSEPVRQFDEQMKELVTMCKDGRQTLLDQVKKFEDETRERVRELLVIRRTELWDQHDVEADFRRAEYDDLILLTSITAKGNLSAKALGELTQRVNADKALQDRTRMRLLELENECFRAGLSAPLTRDHVAGFLFADDAKYRAELDRVMGAEKRREEEAQRRMREKLEREQAEAEQRRQAEEAQRQREEARRQADEEAAPLATPAPPDEPGLIGGPNEPARRRVIEEAAQQDTDRPKKDAAPSRPAAAVPTQGRAAVVVIAEFTTQVPAGVSDEAIERELRKVMMRAGITTLQSVKIVRQPAAA